MVDPADPAVAQERREECRRETLRFLAERQAVAHHPQTIRRALNAGHAADFSEEEVRAALIFLCGSAEPLAQAIPDALGATLYYQATTAGVLAHERSTL